MHFVCKSEAHKAVEWMFYLSEIKRHHVKSSDNSCNTCKGPMVIITFDQWLQLTSALKNYVPPKTTLDNIEDSESSDE